MIPEQLEVLTFRKNGVAMAVDLTQVLEMTPTLLVLRGTAETAEPRAVEIDGPGDILNVPVGSIQPMPGLVAACAGARPYWGAVVLSGSPTLLVDLDELAP